MPAKRLKPEAKSIGTGGRQQRARLNNELVDQVQSYTYDSELALFLLEEWSWGKLSAPEVQVFAKKAYDDQLKVLRANGVSDECASSSLKQLGGLGSSGKHVSNIHQELIRWLGDSGTLHLPIKMSNFTCLNHLVRRPTLKSLWISIFFTHTLCFRIITPPTSADLVSCLLAAWMRQSGKPFGNK